MERFSKSRILGWRKRDPLSFLRLGARLQSASHPSSELGRFEVKLRLAIVFNGLEVSVG
jgi:hypothetical protein